MTTINRRQFIKTATAVLTSWSVYRLLRRRVVGSPAATAVQALWCGALTPTSIRINARLAADSSTVRAVVSTAASLSYPLFSGFATAVLATNNRMVGLDVTGLQPATPYFYAVESEGVVETAVVGQFTTPSNTFQSFTFALGSCASTATNHPVFDTIQAHNPFFYLITGDFHYESIANNQRSNFRAAYDAVLASPRQADLYHALPVAYMWDDHDYGPNDSDATAPGREAARLTYQEYVPHYPLAAGSGSVPIYQAFTIGRVRFILTDLRSERSAKSAPDNAAKSMMGAAQKAWFKQELLTANGSFPLIVWVCTMPWIASPTAGADHWGGCTTERRELANFIKDNTIQGLLMLCGDAHMVAIDDGRNSDYADGGGAAFPVFHAAALDRSGSVKGGPYSHGTYPGLGQFGMVTVDDLGWDEISVCLTGRNDADAVLVSHCFTVPATPLTVPAERLYFPFFARSD
jgi:phosphodiesterase/alkaline phosphatase D-like protein